MYYPLKKSLFGAILFLCLVTFGSVAAAQGFSADVYTMSSGKETAQHKMYYTADKMRVETDQAITITRIDKKAIWILRPSEKMYTEQALRLDRGVPTKDPMPGEIERTYLGTETVNGYSCNKYRITVKTPDNNRDTTLTWLTVDTYIPVRVSAEDGKWAVDYRNIVLGEPDPALFEVPRGYHRMSMHMDFGM